MSKITIIEGNSNDKDNVRAYMVKGEKGDQGDLNNGDIIDNLTSSATDKVLSANQGKVLKNLIDANEMENENTYATKVGLNEKATTLQNQINSLASGSPKGTYIDAAALKAANPETGVYTLLSNAVLCHNTGSE